MSRSDVRAEDLISADKPVYLDYSATTPVDPEVLEAMMPYLADSFGNPSSAHAYGRRAREAVEEAREGVANLIGGESEEIVFRSGGTETDNHATGTVRLRPSI